ncbi:MAG TPA: lipoyl domain-containing protein [Syntrophomonas sp.]|nr:lipoyl domain-containing protein [Syntrophomonas sp.]
MIMPKLGLTMEEGTITHWYKQEGDPVTEGDVLCDVETDKLTNQIESKVNGTLSKILIQEEETVPCHTVIAQIA